MKPGGNPPGTQARYASGVSAFFDAGGDVGSDVADPLGSRDTVSPSSLDVIATAVSPMAKVMLAAIPAAISARRLVGSTREV
jgi:hypothetical protein